MTIDFTWDLSVCGDCFALHGPNPPGTAPHQMCDCEWRNHLFPLPRRDIDDKATNYRLCWCCAAAVLHGSPTQGPYVCGPCLDDIAVLHSTIGTAVVPVSPHAERDHIPPRRFPGMPVDSGLLDLVQRLASTKIPAAVAFGHRRSRMAELYRRRDPGAWAGVGVWDHLIFCGRQVPRGEGLRSLIEFAIDPVAWQAAMPEYRRIFDAG